MKTTYELSTEETKSSIAMWMLSSQRISIDKKAEFSFSKEGIVTIALPESTLPVVIPVPVPIPSEGHKVVADPPMSATGKGTMFGLDWNGRKDPSDNQEGFFIDPSTGRPFNTGNPALQVVSLPREILLSSLGISDEWKTPSLSDDNTSRVWKKTAHLVQEFASKHRISVNIDSGGFSLSDIRIGDVGPDAIGPNGETIGNLVDASFAVAHSLNTHGNALCTIELLVDKISIEIKGWNFTSRRVAA